MNDILIDHHNKLGDHLICSGLVREYCAHYDRVGIFCRPEYRESVSWLFQDVTNIEYVMVANQHQKDVFLVRNTFRLVAHPWHRVLTLHNDTETGILAERQFYGLAGVPHIKKWDNFFVKRDSRRERSLFERLVHEQPYLFIHDDTIYEHTIRPEYFGTGKRVYVQKGATNNIFDYAEIIERALEIHVVDSVFMFLIDLLPYTNPQQNLFVHRYARSNPPWNLPVLRKNWTILR